MPYFKMTNDGLECIDCDDSDFWKTDDDEEEGVKINIDEDGLEININNNDEKDGVNVNIDKDGFEMKINDDGKKAEIKIDSNGLRIK
ncbi:MAG: hypothetical protein L3J20_13880 [Flavobacteriaceae bacterium]|nr:hypothetical protein [Flavobacteriaceae bacterium]